MAKIKKTFSLDEKVIERLELLAAAEGLTLSAVVTTLVNQAAEKRKYLSVKGAE